MRLFVLCANCGNKIYISHPSKTRLELPQLFFLTCPICGKTLQYTRICVYAETSDINTAGGALLGGLVGLVAGGIGAIVGTLLGAILGGGRERQDSEAVARFNNS